MRKRRIINLTTISVIALAGVIVMQAFWVSLSIKTSRAHTKEHVLNAMMTSKTEICEYIFHNEMDQAKAFTRAIIQTELNKIQKPVLFQISIQKSFDDKHIVILEDQGVNYIIDCSKLQDRYLIKVDCRSNSWVFRGQIFWWVALSVLLISLVAMAVALSIINQYKHKKLEHIKKDFVSNMTHELKTPIATISVASEMLLKAENLFLNNEKAKRYSQIIYDENQRLQKLVDKVLMLSIFDKSGNIYKMQKMELASAIQGAIKSLELIIHDKAAKIVYSPPEKPLFIIGDKSHLQQIFANILENALKYSTHNPEIKVGLRLVGETIIVEISDNGPGISNSDKKLIFNKFHRVSNVNIHNVKGYGLGLFYVSKVMEAHGGTIEALDNKPQGALFRLTFPHNL